MSFKVLPRFGRGALAALFVPTMMTMTMMTSTVAGSEDVATPVAEQSQYSAAYAHPARPAGPYDGAVASTYANVVRVPGQHGHVVVKAASHKTVDTPFSSAHKADVRFINDGGAPYYPAPYPAAGPYPYGPAAPVAAGPYAYPPAAPVVAGPYPYAPAAPVVAGPYPYAPAASVVARPYNPHAAAGPYPYATAGPYPYVTAGPYNPYAPAAPIDKAYGYGPAAHSVSHASYSGPYGAHYSYKRR